MVNGRINLNTYILVWTDLIKPCIVFKKVGDD